MSNGPDTPDGWSEVETEWPFQHHTWENDESENVLALETKREPWHEDDENPDYQVILLGPRDDNDPVPIRTIVEQNKSHNAAIEAAVRYMANASE